MLKQVAGIKVTVFKIKGLLLWILL